MPGFPKSESLLKLKNLAKVRDEGPAPSRRVDGVDGKEESKSDDRKPLAKSSETPSPVQPPVHKNTRSKLCSDPSARGPP